MCNGATLTSQFSDSLCCDKLVKFPKLMVYRLPLINNAVSGLRTKLQRFACTGDASAENKPVTLNR